MLCLGSNYKRHKTSDSYRKPKFSLGHDERLHCLCAQKNKNKNNKQIRRWRSRNFRHTLFSFVTVILITWTLAVGVSVASPAGIELGDITVLGVNLSIRSGTVTQHCFKYICSYTIFSNLFSENESFFSPSKWLRVGTERGGIATAFCVALAHPWICCCLSLDRMMAILRRPLHLGLISPTPFPRDYLSSLYIMMPTCNLCLHTQFHTHGQRPSPLTQGSRRDTEKSSKAPSPHASTNTGKVIALPVPADQERTGMCQASPI